MDRRSIVLVAALALMTGCAGPNKLAERSEQKLTGGDHWRAWELASRALQKEPSNVRARHAASAAATVIAQDWRKRIRALADVDSVLAAEQVLEFAAFRVRALPLTVVAVDSSWAVEERLLRRSAARIRYRQAVAELESKRPKKAYLHFVDTDRFFPGYRDATRLTVRAYEQALSRIAFVPLRAPGRPGLGREVAASWRDDVARGLQACRFTRILAGDALERSMTVSQLDGIDREQAIALGRRAKVDRVVWGTIGGVDTDSRIQVFSETIARRVVERDADGRETVRWVDVPLHVLARVRTVTVGLEYEVLATRSGATLARHRGERTLHARALWTAYVPEGGLDSYRLVPDPLRATQPRRAAEIETRWKAVAGDRTTLQQVLGARRATTGPARWRRESASVFLPGGAGFVFLEELPPTEDLVFAVAAGGWEPLRDDLARLDEVDDADLDVVVERSQSR